MTEATRQIAGGDVWEGEITDYSGQRKRNRRRGNGARIANSSHPLVGLADVIEREIAPRLGLRHGFPKPVVGSASYRCVVANDDVMALAQLLLSDDVDSARRFVEDSHASGASMESLYVDLLAPAAKHLDDLWADDRIDFAEVTIGLGYLQQLLRDLSPIFQSECAPCQACDRILLTSALGEQHTFGLSMVAEFFRRAGWDVWGGPLARADDLYVQLRSEWFDLVGISLGREVSTNVLVDFIRAIRCNSRNRVVAVIVCGPWIVQHPESVRQIGADGSASDGGDAPMRADEILRRVRRGG